MRSCGRGGGWTDGSAWSRLLYMLLCPESVYMSSGCFTTAFCEAVAVAAGLGGGEGVPFSCTVQNRGKKGWGRATVCL